MAKADGLKHGRPMETLEVICNCECSVFMPCPVDSGSKCKAAYIEFLKDLKAKADKEKVS